MDRILWIINGRGYATVSGLAGQFPDERAVRLRRMLDQLTEEAILETEFQRGIGQLWRVAPKRGVRLGMREDLVR